MPAKPGHTQKRDSLLNQKANLTASCEGDGTITSKVTCDLCGGDGKVAFGLLPCPDCGGRGYKMVKQTCPTCNGRGYVTYRVPLAEALIEEFI
ncbi:MAG: hypothetical protein AEth_00767 [Candidatus Argoarchaeum ethanivorans]|uniref:CR-type domain-containing protein n=1 Tax=Candidatus Argoarchaeum ethanivorans TaxID=2608793 RepID=A0A8B3S4M5_9EURY|nr:MAG: hypothetical protein AEth_00767 [Candidatus Argoarchaeum ethanivorans]